MADQTYLKALSLWTTSFHFFNVVQNICEKIIENKNERIIVCNSDTPMEELNDKTKWSDQKIVVPVLFNFYHALEILIKGFLIIDAPDKMKPKHSIEHLVSSFENVYIHESVLVKMLKKYTHQSQLPMLLKGFLKKNNLSVSQLYEALRYPLDSQFDTVRTYIDLKYKGKEGVPFFEELFDDINVIRENAVRLGRELKKKQELTSKRSRPPNVSR